MHKECAFLVLLVDFHTSTLDRLALGYALGPQAAKTAPQR
jgi:hypothetical protein